MLNPCLHQMSSDLSKRSVISVFWSAGYGCSIFPKSWMFPQSPTSSMDKESNQINKTWIGNYWTAKLWNYSASQNSPDFQAYLTKEKETYSFFFRPNPSLSHVASKYFSKISTVGISKSNPGLNMIETNALSVTWNGCLMWRSDVFKKIGKDDERFLENKHVIAEIGKRLWKISLKPNCYGSGGGNRILNTTDVHYRRLLRSTTHTPTCGFGCSEGGRENTDHLWKAGCKGSRIWNWETPQGWKACNRMETVHIFYAVGNCCTIFQGIHKTEMIKM